MVGIDIVHPYHYIQTYEVLGFPFEAVASEFDLGVGFDE